MSESDNTNTQQLLNEPDADPEAWAAYVQQVEDKYDGRFIDNIRAFDGSPEWEALLDNEYRFMKKYYLERKQPRTPTPQEL